jgi:LEA14-like dessication related protein
MAHKTLIKLALVIIAASQVSSCATLQDIAALPEVSLQSVQVKDLDFKSQTFVLNFDVSNPNPIALPIKSVSYAVKLDGLRFASGDVVCAFSIPARGDTSFAITADLDLLNTAPQLLTIVRSAMRRDIPYELSGSLGIDLPLVRPAQFSADGSIRLGSGDLSAPE